MNRYRVMAIIMGLLVLAAAIVAPAANAAWNDRGKTETVEFDVAEDMTRFVYDKDVVLENGMPAYGSSFITQGYIYPKGTLSCPEGQKCSGVNADGTAQFPDKVIGEWTCRGFFVGEGAATTTGPMVITTQLYNFGKELGNETLVSEGYELADVGVAIERAITGGTGKYVDARGQGEQQMLGLNLTDGVTLRLKLNPRTR